MSDSYFLDTNVFVYSFDRSNEDKQEKARSLIVAGLDSRRGVISFQVVQEFLNVATRKFEAPLSVADCRTYMDCVLGPLCGIWSSIPLYQKTLELRDRWRYSFYDSLMVAAALHVGCRTLYSEDLQNGQVIETLTIVNPFA